MINFPASHRMEEKKSLGDEKSLDRKKKSRDEDLHDQMAKLVIQSQPLRQYGISTNFCQLKHKDTPKRPREQSLEQTHICTVLCL